MPELEELERQIAEVRVMAEDALDKFPIRSTTTPGATRERHIHDLGKHPGGVIAARVFNSGNIAVANNTDVYLTFDSERFDTDTIHSTSSNTGRLTCKTAGKYIISETHHWETNTTERRTVCFIRLNGATRIAETESRVTTGGTVSQTITTIYDLAVDDFVEVGVFQGSGVELDVLAASNHSPEFMMARIGAAGTTGGGTPGTDHGGLTGLGDDDHTLYILATGTRAFTGEQSMGTNKLTNVVDPTVDQDTATKKYVDDNSGSLATDTLWAAQGDLVKGTGNDTAGILSVGADHTVMVSNGTDPLYSASPPLAAIADTGDTDRIKLSASDPNVEIDDTLRCEGITIGVVTSGVTTRLRISPTETTSSVWNGIDVSPAVTHSASQNLFAIKGIASVQAADTSDQTIFGLQFEIGPQVRNKTSSFTEGVAVDATALAIGVKTTTDTVFTMTDMAVFRGVLKIQSAGVQAGVTVTVTTGHGLHLEAPISTGTGTLAITTYYGIKVDDITIGTNVYPLFVAGGSDDQDHYSVHEPNLVLFKSITAGDDFMGLSTAAKAGDGVLGWGNAATAPDEVTNPTGGLILWAAAGALLAIGSSGTKTTIAAAEPHCPECGNDFVLEWSNKGRGTHLQICMWCYASAGGAGVMKQDGY